MNDNDLNDLINELMGREKAEPEWKAKLLACVNRNLQIRDRSHIEPYKLLLYTEETDSLESVELSELALRHPWEVHDGRWQNRDVGALLKHKLTLWRSSRAAHELASEGVMSQECGTVVLVVPKDDTLPFTWIELKARTVAED